MKLNLLKEIFLAKLNLSSKFTSAKLSSLATLQGILIEIKKGKMNFYATNLNSYFHTTLSVKTEEEAKFLIEPKKIIEFISLIPTTSIDLNIDKKQIIISSGKTTGKFPFMTADDFPQMPVIKNTKSPINKDFFKNNLPLVLFAASSDEARPVLTGVNFLTSDNETNIVSTDGFRLSLMKAKKQITSSFPSIIIPADFLEDLYRFVKTESSNEKEILFGYSKEEKAIVFIVEDNEFYSRLIEGDFPQFEKVIPAETSTKIKIEKDDFLRNIKLASVFARDYSNIIIFDIRKDGLYIRPRVDTEGNDDLAFQEVEFEGKEQKIAFNFRFVLDFINHAGNEKIIIEVARSEAPAIFKLEKNPDFIHLIMPVRIEV